jgi:hypothetical protein
MLAPLMPVAVQAGYPRRMGRFSSLVTANASFVTRRDDVSFTKLDRDSETLA